LRKSLPLSNYRLFFSKKKALPFFCHKSELSKQYMSFRIIWRKFATIANLATNQELILVAHEKPQYNGPFMFNIFGIGTL